MSDSGGIDWLSLMTIGVAASAFIVSAFTYRRNKRSDQIKIAREQMDKINTKYERLLEVKIESLVEEEVTSPSVFLFHVEEVMKECRYFGYLVHKKIIVDDDIISYYEPEIIQIFVELIIPGRDAFQKMKARSQRYPDLIKNVEGHIKLVDEILLYWG
ncbi:MAG TPA: hypothetical protein VE130_08595 [Nitrososphaeraceae archaeon]|nr:hypothetical protein [Nitrososphaeraceae archaeon]